MGSPVIFVAMASAIVATTTIAAVYVITVRVPSAVAVWAGHRGGKEKICLPGAGWSPGSVTVAQGERSGNFFPFCTALF